ncbi:response regulator transcription factor [Epilithonimonas hungarica]|uniref:response regulator transcription factor n=1 Tax=Epilithonimonas hungarica TaxID=454006 RepID=UPI0012C1BAD9|nr:response regulator transcription factor [Epilithonimonas hungarica]MPT33042.1 response regulator transcription factor [Chryseobacterium sp.]
MIRIGIVDDHPIFLDGITNVLSSKPNFQILFSVDIAKKVLENLKDKEIDILITDISMPEINGLELINFIRKEKKNIKIIVMSSFKNAESKDNIDAYLLKNTPKEKLFEVIEDLHYDNKKYFYSEDIDFEKINFNKNILSQREKEIVISICEGFTTMEISERLFISKNTVETHRKNIFFKLNISTTAQLVSMAMKFGIIN